MAVNREIIFQLFKYTVYVLLAINVYVFFAEEFAAAKLQFPDGVGFADLIEAYASSIDTFAWVVLLLMFELETYVLDDDQFTKPVTLTLHGVRAICYGVIVYAFYGYVVNLTFLHDVSAFQGLTDLCTLAPDGWSYAIDIDEYTAITAANCASFSTAAEFIRFPNEMRAVVDADGLAAIVGLAWIDVINSGVWLLVVLVLEIDVRLQERNRYEGGALIASNVAKVFLYGTLLYAAIYWGLKGDFVDFWDAFLWLVAFVFIELNVFEWRQEAHEQAASEG